MHIYHQEKIWSSRDDAYKMRQEVEETWVEAFPSNKIITKPLQLSNITFNWLKHDSTDSFGKSTWFHLLNTGLYFQSVFSPSVAPAGKVTFGLLGTLKQITYIKLSFLPNNRWGTLKELGKKKKRKRPILHTRNQRLFNKSVTSNKLFPSRKIHVQVTMLKVREIVSHSSNEINFSWGRAG